jgi:hypothetical protein
VSQILSDDVDSLAGPGITRPGSSTVRPAFGPVRSWNPSLLYQLTGVDLVAIPGLNASTVQTLLSEIGLDIRVQPRGFLCAGAGTA